MTPRSLEPPHAASLSTQDLRQKVFRALEPRPDDTGFERALNLGLLGLILLNVGAVIVETLEDLPPWARNGLSWFEVFSVIVFAIEYTLRAWTSSLDPRYASPITGRLRYICSPLALIDLAAIVPFFVPWLTAVDLRYMRALRLTRLFRVFKVARYTRAFHTLGAVLSRKRADLVIAGSIALLIIVCASSTIYFIERDAQPAVFSSIPSSMWWAVSTLTTVGYGDVYPVTTLGKLLAAVVEVLGVAMFALPTGILATGFVEELQRNRDAARPCPHCGLRPNDGQGAGTSSTRADHHPIPPPTGSSVG